MRNFILIFSIFGAIIFSTLIFGAFTFAQETPAGAADGGTRKADSAPGAGNHTGVITRPPTYVPLQTPTAQEGIPLYLMNKDGRLVVMPGFRLEQLEQMMRAGEPGPRVEKAGKSTAFPDYVIHNIRGTGEIGREFVRLSVEFELETFMDVPVCVPLRFDNGVLFSPGKVFPGTSPAGESENTPDGEKNAGAAGAAGVQTPEIRKDLQLARSYEGPGRLWLEFRQDDGGFTAWVLGKGLHHLRAEFLVPVTRAGEKNAIHIPFPQATMSEIMFQLPQTRGESERFSVSVSEGGTLLPPAFSPAVGEGNAAGVPGGPDEKGVTSFHVMQLKNDLRISWLEPEKKQEISRTVLEVEGLVGTIIEKAGIRFQTRLKVNVHGAATDHFRVCLPAGAELVPVFSPDYTLSVIQETAPAGDTAERSAGGKIVTDGESGEVYPAEEAAAEQGDLPGTGRQVVEVRLKEKAAGTVWVEIHARITQEMGSYSEWLNLGGFEVLDATRQTGYYAVRTDVARHHLWAPGPGVRHVDALPASVSAWMHAAPQAVSPAPVSGGGEEKPEAEKEAGHPEGIRSNGAAEETAENAGAAENPGSPAGGGSVESAAETGVPAGAAESDPALAATVETPPPAEEMAWDAYFEYTSQPLMLLTRLVTRSVRFNVEPEYDVTVTQDEILLKGTWKCFIRGGKVAWIDVDFGDWIFDSVGPDNLISVESLEVDADGRMSIPLIQPTTGNLVLTFQARRKITETDTELAFSFPRPVVNHAMAVVQTVASAEVRVQAAMNVELMPSAEGIRHLVRVPRSVAGAGASHAPNTLYYRAESPEAVFAATRTIHPQQISVRQFSRLEVYPEQYRVCQTYEYTVAYVPLRQLKFTLPEMGTERVDVLVTEQASGVTGSAGAGISPAGRRASVDFPVTGHPRAAFPVAAQPEGVAPAVTSVAVTGTVTPESGVSAREKEKESAARVPAAAQSPGGAGMPLGSLFSSIFHTRRPMVTINPAANPAVNPAAAEETAQRKMDVTVLLGEEKLGVFYVTFVYTFPTEKLQSQASRMSDFLLGVPHEGKLTDNRLQVFANPAIRVFPLDPTVPETPWQEVTLSPAENFLQTEVLSRVQQEGMGFIRRNRREPAAEGGVTGEAAAESAPVFSQAGNDFRFSAAVLNCWCAMPEDRIRLALELKETDPLTVTIIDRYWLQTWMTGKVRQDRAVFCFPPVVDTAYSEGISGSEAGGVSVSGSGAAYARKFTIQLPPGASADEADVWIDRHPAEIGTQVKRLSANSLQVTLHATRESVPRTVEIRYQFTKTLSTEETLGMEIPYVVDATWIRGMYWQVVLPGNMHIMSPPQGFSMEYRWGWNQLFWGRVPLWEQGAFEKWCGAVQGAPVPVTMNRYVFAGMGSRDTLKDGVSVYLVNRTSLVVALALGVFVLGFIFIHFPWTRHPLFLLAVLVMVGAVGVQYPDLLLLALQASALGAVLVVISLLFNIFYRPAATGWSKTKIMMEADTTVSPSPRPVITPVTDELSPTRTYAAEELTGDNSG